jgi:hypothetical protein
MSVASRGAELALLYKSCSRLRILKPLARGERKAFLTEPQ